jgi:hypothetical protein
MCLFTDLGTPRRTGIACLAGEGHQCVLVESAGLVVGCLQDGGASHGRFGCGDDGEVLSSNTK